MIGNLSPRLIHEFPCGCMLVQDINGVWMWSHKLGKDRFHFLGESP